MQKCKIEAFSPTVLYMQKQTKIMTCGSVDPDREKKEGEGEGEGENAEVKVWKLNSSLFVVVEQLSH